VFSVEAAPRLYNEDLMGNREIEFRESLVMAVEDD
jgi:hypothetical protein